MSQRHVDTSVRKQAARNLKDAAATGFPLSDKEAAVLQLLADDNPACFECDWMLVFRETTNRNPRVLARDAREQARGLQRTVAGHWDLLSAEDRAFLEKADRARNITLEQVKVVSDRYGAAFQKHLNAMSEDERLRYFDNCRNRYFDNCL